MILRSWLQRLTSAVLLGTDSRNRRRFTRRRANDAAPSELLETRALLAANLFVDVNNTTGTEDGTALHPYNSVQEAATAAAATEDVTIRVAQGTYAENVIAPNTNLQLLGGFAGGSADDYANGLSGDFAAADLTSNVTRITGDMNSPVVALSPIAKTIVIDGFVISG